jgi:ubiquinone/menaquinone biosynthesis C-methylase UbiE
MQIKTYKYYSEVYDLFSNEVIFPQNIDFIREVWGYISPGDRITDVGGGTGYFTGKILGVFPTVQLTFIEPSPEMMSIARERLPGSTVFLQKKFAEALPALERQNLFIFQRCLYCFHDNLKDYQELARKIYEKTEPGGHIAIFEIEGKYDIDQMKEYLEGAREHLRLDQKEFMEKWEVFERVLREFNDLVDRQVFTVFTPDEMTSIFGRAGFTPLPGERQNIYFFRK